MWRRWSGPPALLAAGLLAGPATAADDPEVPPRSVYAPVWFEVAPCLRDVVVRTEEGEVRAVAPGRLVSQFAFHDRRPGAAPEWEPLTVEGRIEPPPGEVRAGAAPEPFRVGIVITPTSIYIGRKRLDLGLEGRLGAFRRRTDLRVPERTLRLGPARQCAGPPQVAGRPPPRW